MHGLRAENYATTTSVEGPSSIMIARGILFWTGNRRADWKVVSRFANMGRLLPLGAYPSGTHMGNTGFQEPGMSYTTEHLAEAAQVLARLDHAAIERVAALLAQFAKAEAGCSSSASAAAPPTLRTP